MSGLAELLHLLGAKVTGSDLSDNQQVQRLQSLGVYISREHSAANVGDIDVVVFSSAIKKNHVELEEARRLGIPLIARAEALAELMRLKRGIAIAGTHGKTTTTSLLASAFIAAKQDPSVVVGGKLQILGSNAVWGRGPWMIAEADESDGSFSKLSPEVIVITNIDNDHLDFYGSFENLKKSFLNFASQVPFYGLVVACGDDPHIRDVFSGFSKRVKFYGYGEENDYQIVTKDGVSRVLLKDGNDENEKGMKELINFSFQLPGRHNVLNAVAAITVSKELGLPIDMVKVGIETFSGVDRRAQWIGKKNDVDVYDDYGHHPTEVKLTIAGFKEKFQERRLVVCFQPHRVSRTKICWNQFLTAFDGADEVWLIDIYTAGEKQDKTVTAEKLSQEIKHENCRYISREDLSSTQVKSDLRPGDVFLTLGAGDGWKIGREFVDHEDGP